MTRNYVTGIKPLSISESMLSSVCIVMNGFSFIFHSSESTWYIILNTVNKLLKAKDKKNEKEIQLRQP